MDNKKPVIEVDTSVEGQTKPNPLKLTPLRKRILTGVLLGLLPIIWMFLPLLKIEKNGTGLTLTNWQIFFGGQGLPAFSLLFIIFLLPLVASVLYIFAKRYPRLNFFALIIYLGAGAIAFLGQAIYAAILANDEAATYVVKTQIGLVFLGVTAVVGALFCFSELLHDAALTIRDMTEIAALVGIAVVLDQFVKIDVTGAGAGSIGLATLPLFIIAYRLGAAKGFIAGGVVFGILTNILDGYGIATYPFDYLLAFGLVGLAGLFRNLAFPRDGKVKPLHLVWYGVGIIVGTLGRYLGSVISSMVLYGANLGFALTYNWYILLSGLVVLILMLILYRPLIIINKRFPTSESRNAANQ